MNAANQHCNPHVTNADVGRRLREHRLLHGMTLGEMGAALCVSQQQVQKYEQGKDAIPLVKLLKAAHLWKLHPAVLLTEFEPVCSEPAADVDRVTVSLLKAFRRIKNTAMRRKVLDLVRQIAEDGD
jgi:transcriptional regulator with XRE-family HTH domain